MEKEINSITTVTFQFDDDEVIALHKAIEVVQEIANTITDYDGEYLNPDAALKCGWDKIHRDDLVKVVAQLTYLLEVVDGTEGAEIW